ncbi:MAG: hypothetical protein Q7L55_05815 [Actinomycetota bacterium]|nr:hypothetical protein [Actinomycetota bacterium]
MKLAVTGVIVALILFAAALWSLVLSPRISTAAQLKEQSAQVEQANITLARRHGEILDLAAKAPQLAHEAQQLFSRMPESAKLPAVLRQIAAAAIASGISTQNVLLINTSIPESLDKVDNSSNQISANAASSLGVNLATMTIEITVNGSQAQRLRFLDKVQHLDRGLLINAHSTITDGTHATSGTLTVTGTMFVLQSKLPDLVAKAQTIIDKAQQEAVGQKR